MAKVTYEGPTRRDDTTGQIVVDRVVFRKDLPVEVDDEKLLKELREGSDRLQGHKFTVSGGGGGGTTAKGR
jgi:hypothetical protein